MRAPTGRFASACCYARLGFGCSFALICSFAPKTAGCARLQCSTGNYSALVVVLRPGLAGGQGLGLTEHCRSESGWRCWYNLNAGGDLDSERPGDCRSLRAPPADSDGIVT